MKTIITTPGQGGTVKSDRIKATHAGKLFDGLLDCYVLEDERRVVSQRGVVRALTNGGRESGNLSAYLGRLPSRFKHLATGAKITFTRPDGGTAKGRDVHWLSDLLDAYVDAFMAGELHHTQEKLAQQARKIQSAATKIGWMALVDEATQYQLVRAATALSFAYRAILLDSTCQWDLMWTPDFTESMCRLHCIPFDGTQPRFLGSTYEKLYRLVLSNEVYEELKRRNPEPCYGTNHHQWLTPEAREVIRCQIPILTALAETCGSKEQFWELVESRYTGRPLQLTCFLPSKDPAS